MDYKILTPEMVEKADSYVKTADKERFINFAAPRCIDKIEVTAGDGASRQAFPNSYKVNEQRKRRYMMGAFLKLYIHQEFQPVENDPWIIDETEYDMWSGGHVFNQMDRMKKRGDVLRDKAFDILEDYNNLRRYLNYEIEQMLLVMNDPCTRLMNMMQMQTTPEYIEEQVEQLKTITSEIDKYKNGEGK